jgi:hypothetical protein
MPDSIVYEKEALWKLPTNHNGDRRLPSGITVNVQTLIDHTKRPCDKLIMMVNQVKARYPKAYDRQIYKPTEDTHQPPLCPAEHQEASSAVTCDITYEVYFHPVQIDSGQLVEWEMTLTSMPKPTHIPQQATPKTAKSKSPYTRQQVTAFNPVTFVTDHIKWLGIHLNDYYIPRQYVLMRHAELYFALWTNTYKNIKTVQGRLDFFKDHAPKFILTPTEPASKAYDDICEIRVEFGEETYSFSNQLNLLEALIYECHAKKNRKLLDKLLQAREITTVCIKETINIRKLVLLCAIHSDMSTLRVLYTASTTQEKKECYIPQILVPVAVKTDNSALFNAMVKDNFSFDVNHEKKAFDFSTPHRADGYTLAHLAAEHGSLETLKSIIELVGPDVLSKLDTYGHSPIYPAFETNQEEILQWIASTYPGLVKNFIKIMTTMPTPEHSEGLEMHLNLLQCAVLLPEEPKKPRNISFFCSLGLNPPTEQDYEKLFMLADAISNTDPAKQAKWRQALKLPTRQPTHEPMHTGGTIMLSIAMAACVAIAAYIIGAIANREGFDDEASPCQITP